jgi:uncharacterized protein with PQ loop repeat
MFGFAALAIGYLVAGLQLVRVVRGHRLGVAPLTWAMVGVLSAGWAAFYLNLGEYPTAIGNIVFSPVALSIAILCSPSRWGALVKVVSALVVAVAAVFFFPQVGEPVLATVAAFMLVPQLVVVVKAWRERTSLDGVSVSAWTLNVAVASLWLAQGVVFRSPEMLFANGVLLLTSIPIVAIVAVQPRRLATVS